MELAHPSWNSKDSARIPRNSAGQDRLSTQYPAWNVVTTNNRPIPFHKVQDLSLGVNSKIVAYVLSTKLSVL